MRLRAFGDPTSASQSPKGLMNAAWREVMELDRTMARYAPDEDEHVALSARQTVLQDMLGDIGIDDDIDLSHGLQFVLRQLLGCCEATTTTSRQLKRALCMTRKLLTTHKTKKRATRAPGVRPKGRAPKGKTWSPTKDCWVVAAGYTEMA